MADDELHPDDNARDFQPWDVDIEQTLLGLALIEPSAIAFIQAECSAADFYDPLHQRLFERIFVKNDAGSPVTPLTLHASMKNDAGMIEVGGKAYLISCARSAPAFVSTEHLESMVTYLARTLADLHVRRYAEDALADSAEMLRQGLPVEQSLLPIVSVADTENERIAQQRGVVSIVDAGYQLLKKIETGERENLSAAPTGLRALNELIGGYFSSNLIVAGGRPGMGKSILGEVAARSAAAAGWSVDYFDLENRAGVLTSRMLCDIDYDRALKAGKHPIHYSRIHLNRLSEEEKDRLADATIALRDLDISIHDRDELTMAQITSLCRAKAARTKRKMLVIIDHMHLIEPSNRYAGRKVDEISEVTKGAKRLAKRLDASVMLLAQLNRDLERRDDKRPTMADFRESGSIEQDADIMLGLNRPHYHLERSRPKSDAKEEDRYKYEAALLASANVLELGVLKNRHGKTGELILYCDVASSVIRDEKPPVDAVLDFGPPGLGLL